MRFETLVQHLPLFIGSKVEPHRRHPGLPDVANDSSGHRR